MGKIVLRDKDLASMIDLSAVQTYMGDKENSELMEIAHKYGFKYISVFASYIPFIQNLCRDMPDSVVIGNIGFPSGGETTASKIFQAKELYGLGCKEVDMVINVGYLKSKKYKEVEDEIRAVKASVNELPLKVILEVSYLTDEEIIKGCELSMKAGASFVKTGTGWTPNITTVENIKLMKSFVGDKIKIKASGGVRNLATLIDMYKAGARRFGINLNNAVKIIEECRAMPNGSIEIEE